MIKVSGREIELKSSTVSGLLNQLKIDTTNVAVVRNGAVIKRSVWETEPVCDGDSIEIFSPVSGG
ncbi:MAG TPA: sulfur carrier protein ThiS [bacterium]|jgi:sulfur carrier protein|nr:sulfur carrier protein ThiS [bacterium]